MAPQHALVALLTLASTAFGQLTTESSSRGSAFWTATQRYMVSSTTTTSVRYSTSTATYTQRTTRTALSTVTPKAAVPTSTYSSRYYNDLDIIYEFYTAGAFAESELEPPYVPLASRTSSITSSSTIIFSMPVTMTAPASCSNSYTYSTTTSVSVPSQVWGQIKPSSTRPATTTTRYDGDVYTYQTYFLSANAAPFTSSRNFDYSYYIASCSTVPGFRSSATSTSSPRSGGGSTSSNEDYCYGRYSYYCTSSLKTWIIIVASVIPGLFLLGILESWFWFRRLMNGKSAMRFGTCCWVLISLWILCFTRMQDARSKEDQVVLQEKWKNMGSGAAFKAWMKWGFRHSYPVEHLGQYSKFTVGIVPAGQPIHPEMAQGLPQGGYMPGAPPAAFQPGPPGAPGAGQVYYYGPPPTGWVPTPDGQGFMPPQGYNYPSPHQSGYYGADVAKDRSTISSSPVSAMGPQQAYSQQRQSHVQGQAPSPTPGSLAVHPPPAQSGATAPVGFSQVVQQHNASPAAQEGVSEAPANPSRTLPASAPTAPAPSAPAAQHPPKSDPNDRSLYE